MASVIKSNGKETTNSDKPVPQDTRTADVQSYLISNYKDALKKGDKSAAKSCLLAARYFSVDDPHVTNEIYMMAKSDGDVSEASKCFANIFTDLFISSASSSPQVISNELLAVKNQIKEETRILLGELKSQYLKLKTLPAPASLPARQIGSVNPSPMLSPRMRMSSEDRMASRETLAKLDAHLPSSARNFFYHQLFDNLPEDIKKSVLNHSIDNCDNLFERCRLMMLALTISSDSAPTYSGRLLRTLIDLSDPAKKLEESKRNFNQTQSPIMCQYAKSLLVLDAIPLVINVAPLSSIDIDIDELFEHTLNFYSSHCLETSAKEYDSNELHEGVKKSIATRILGIEHNSPTEEAIEESLIATLNLLAQKSIESFTNPDVKSKFEKLRKIMTGKSDSGNNFEQLNELICSLSLENILTEDIDREESSGSQPTATPPPKARGRPKKVQQSPVSSDSVVKKSQQNKSREAHIAFFSIVQYMFTNCASYLKSTRSRILMKFDNPLASLIESELVKTSSQRTSRSKSGSQQSNDSSSSPTKKIKSDNQLKQVNTEPTVISPLNSEQSKILDLNILTNLINAHKCLEFLNSNHGPFTKLWNKLSVANKNDSLQWFRRLSTDSMILSNEHDKASQLLWSFFEDHLDNAIENIDSEIKKIQTNSDILTVKPNVGTTSVADLRTMAQLVSCEVQKLNRSRTFYAIVELISAIKRLGLLANDENHSSGSSIDEYMVIVKHKEENNLGFLFFDSLSMIRYCVDVLMNILKCYVTSASVVSDTAIGHTIVLSQFDWPKKSPIYCHCILWIRGHKPKSTTPQCLSATTKFTYPDFFRYIRNPNIIEDFMAMLRQGYTLDIKSPNETYSPYSSQTRTGNSSQSSSTSSRGTSGGSGSRSSKVITTRGVNKTFKEDLKVAIVSQMRNSSYVTSLDMMSDFIQTSLIPYLSSTKK